jgi:hypothetical protein
MEEGHLIGVETGRTADVFSGFLKQLPALWESEILSIFKLKIRQSSLPDNDSMFYFAT